MTARKPIDTGQTNAEKAATKADAKAQELGEPLANPQPRIARTYVQAKHPDTGLAVTFVPGERLPDWVKLKAGDEA